MKKNTWISETQKGLLKAFPEIDIEVSEKIDKNIKRTIIKYQSENINKDISNNIYQEIHPYINNTNRKKTSKKCNKLAAQYIENHRIWMLQENWYCVLTYLLTVATMILRVIEIDQRTNDWVTFDGYFVAVLFWLIIIKSKKLMGKEVEEFLTAFNNHAPFLTIVNLFLFYFVVCVYPFKKNLWVITIVLPFVFCIWLTWHWYRKRES